MARYEGVQDAQGRPKQTHPIYGMHDPEEVDRAIREGTGEYVLMEYVAKVHSWRKRRGARRSFDEKVVRVYVHRDDVAEKKRHGFYEIEEVEPGVFRRKDEPAPEVEAKPAPEGKKKSSARGGDVKG